MKYIKDIKPTGISNFLFEWKRNKDYYSISMTLFHRLSFTKIICWGIIWTITRFYIDPFKDTAVAIAFMLIAVFLVTWGFMFFLYLYSLYFISNKKVWVLSSTAYKLSFLTAIFIAVNWVLLAFDIWSKQVGLIVTALFVTLYTIWLSNND